MGGKPPSIVVVLAAAALVVVVAACRGEERRAPTATLSPSEPASAPAPTRTPTSLPAAELPPEVTLEAADGRFTVYRMYVQVRRFVEEAKANREVDRWEVYRALVVEPMEPFFSYLGITNPDWQQKWAEWLRSADLEALDHTAALMETVGVDVIAAAALEDVAETLDPKGKRHVFLLPGVFPYNGFDFYGHVTAGGAATIFLYAFGIQDPTPIWRESLPRLVAHEAHHSVRLSQGKFPLTLIGEIVFEGLAEIFAEEMYGQVATPEAMDKETERRLWAEIREDPYTTDSQMIRRYFQGAEDVPAQAGYHIGRQLIRAYKANHPGSTAAGLVGKSEFEIYETSGYAP